MNKARAIELLGGTVTAAAQEIGVTPSAVTQWPDELPPRLVDRVQAALWRMQHKGVNDPSTPAQPTAQQEAAHG
jgi:transposase-like protein